jgi:hypothetical protein
LINSVAKRDNQMAAVYSNRFTIEISDVARIVFVDERAPAAQGLPTQSVTATEVVLSRGNFIALAEQMTKIVEKMKKGS